MNDPNAVHRFGRGVPSDPTAMDPGHGAFPGMGEGTLADSTDEVQKALDEAGAVAAAVGRATVIMEAGRRFHLTAITIPANVSLVADGVAFLRHSYAGSGSALITMESGSSIRGHLQIDGRGDSVTGVGPTDAHYGITVLGDDVDLTACSLMIEGFTTGRCRHLRIRGDRCRTGTLRSRDASYSSVFIQPGGGSKKEWCHVGVIESVNAAYKGLNYSGAAGFEEIQIDHLHVTTDSEERAFDALLFDSGDPDPTDTDTVATIRVDRLVVGDVHASGGRSNSIKIQNVGDATIGRAWCDPSPTAVGYSVFVSSPRVRIGELVATRHVRTRGSLEIGLYRYLGSGERALEVTGMLGQEIQIGRLEVGESTMSGAAIRITRGSGRNVHVESYDSTTSPLLEVATSPPVD